MQSIVLCTASVQYHSRASLCTEQLNVRISPGQPPGFPTSRRITIWVGVIEEHRSHETAIELLLVDERNIHCSYSIFECMLWKVA